MSSVDLTTAIDAQARITIVQSLLEGLRNRSSQSSLLLCTTLLADHDGLSDAQQALVQILLAEIKQGQLDEAIEAASSSTWLRRVLLERLITELNDSQDIASPGSAHMLASVKRLTHYDTHRSTAIQALRMSLQYACRSDRVVAFAAKELIYTLLSIPDLAIEASSELRESTSHLLSSSALPFQKTLGHSLWLRQMMSSPSHSFISYMHEQSYFDLIANGLWNGDNERRKLCLEILKLSVEYAIDSGEPALITSRTTTPRTALISQYTRFCTVFETLTIARYQNLLLETERDLNSLASASSAVDKRWLYVLLDCALAADMQDSSRQTIGKWIISGSLEPATDSVYFSNFLRISLLPWLAEGHLYVSSLSQSTDRTWHCAHGQQVTTLVRSTVKKGGNEIFNVYIQHILDHRNNLFAYAAMHIMRGLAESTSSVDLDLAACRKVLELSSWQALPEVAKESFRRDCLKILQSQAADSLLQDAGEEIKIQYRSLKRRYDNQTSATNVEAQGGYSARERKVQECAQRCAAIRLGSPDLGNVTLADTLDDIWSEIEYLVYPRELIESVPATLLCDYVVRAAAEDQDVLAIVDSTLQRYLDMLETRSNLFAPLTLALNNAMSSTPFIIQLLPTAEIVLRIARSPPGPKPDLKLEYATLSLLKDDTTSVTSLYASESHGYAAYLYLVARLGQQQDIVRSIQDSIVSRWLKQKIPPPSISPWKTTLQLQVLILSLEQLRPTPLELNQLLDDLFWLLSVEPLPSYRYLFSWMIMRLLIRFTEQQIRLPELLGTTDHHSNPKYLAALMKLSIELLGAVDADEAFAMQTASTFIALSASSKIIIRHEAQWSFPLLMDLARKKKWTNICDNLACISLDDYIRSLPRFGEPPLERIYSRFDPVMSNTFTNVAEGPWTNFDWAGYPVARREDFVWLMQNMVDNQLADLMPCLELGEAIEYAPRNETKPQLEPGNTAVQQEDGINTIALQTKGSAYLQNMLESADTRSRKHQLIVLGSLVTNPYNLGGLSRVSEIFGVQALYVGDTKVKAHKDFTSVAVSSDQHLDIRSLPQGDIAAFLSEKKTEGWTVVGVEQTDRSDMLGNVETHLPDKTILIIGNEREGMPGSVISLCDVLIEIPQVGVTRSMNVQTVAAVVLYEYNRQRTNQK